MFPNLQVSPHLISAAVFAALAAYDVRCATAFQRLYAEPTDQTINGQIVAANQFWRFQLGMSECNTRDARECLIDQINPEDWMRLFATHVAPVAVAVGAPCQLPSFDIPNFGL